MRFVDNAVRFEKDLHGVRVKYRPSVDGIDGVAIRFSF